MTLTFLEIVKSCQPLRYTRSPLNISETVKDRGLVPEDHQ